MIIISELNILGAARRSLPACISASIVIVAKLAAVNRNTTTVADTALLSETRGQIGLKRVPKCAVPPSALAVTWPRPTAVAQKVAGKVSAATLSPILDAFMVARVRSSVMASPYHPPV